MNIDKGYIRLSRGYFDNPLWSEPRDYSRAEAWLDLIQSARFDSSKIIVKGRVIELQRGEIAASRRYLENRWGWGGTKVSNFLELLKTNQMITIKQTSGQTIISLCNYSVYNDSQTSGQTTDKPRTNHRQTTDKPNINKEKKEKKEISIPPSPNGDVPPLVDGVDLVDSNLESSPDDPQAPKILTEEEAKKKKLREKEKENFEKFQIWILEHAPRVAQMTEPFTQPEFERLKKEFTIKQIQDITQNMHNYKLLFSKSISANLTFRNWAKKDYNNEPTTIHRSATVVATTTQSKSERDAQFAEKIARQLANRPR